MQAAGLPTAESQAKIKKWSEIQSDFLGQTGLKRQYGREEIPKALKNNSQNGIIDIEIDEFVPCLKENKSGKIVKTTARDMEHSSLQKYNKKNGWYIDWAKVPKDMTIRGIFVDGEDEPQGFVAFKAMPENMTIQGHWAVANPKSNKKKTDNPQYSGIGGHLFALMAAESKKLGFDGFVQGKAANERLLQHYIDEFGAQPLGGYEFYINEQSANALLEKYNWEE